MEKLVLTGTVCFCVGLTVAGFEIVGRVTLKHKKSGKVFH